MKRAAVKQVDGAARWRPRMRGGNEVVAAGPPVDTENDCCHREPATPAQPAHQPAPCGCQLPAPALVRRFLENGVSVWGPRRPVWRPDFLACLKYTQGDGVGRNGYCVAPTVPCYACRRGACAFHSRGVCVDCGELLARDLRTGRWTCYLCRVSLPAPKRWLCYACCEAEMLAFCIGCGCDACEVLHACIQCDQVLCDDTDCSSRRCTSCERGLCATCYVAAAHARSGDVLCFGCSALV